MNRTGTLFVSYASQDKDVASHIVSFLEGRGERCWIAPRDILSSCDWAESIIDGIDSASGMVLLLSRHSNESPQVRREVERAVSRGIPIHPLLLEKVRLSKWMQYYISAHQWNDASDVSLDRRLAELYKAVRAEAESELDLNVISSRFADDLAGLEYELDNPGRDSERLQPGERRNVYALHINIEMPDRETASSVRMAVSKTVTGLIERYALFYNGYLERLSLDSYRCIFGLEQVRENDGSRTLNCAVFLMKSFDELNSVLQNRDLRVNCGLGVASGMVLVDESGIDGSSLLLTARELAESSSGSLAVTGAIHSLYRNEYCWRKESDDIYLLTDNNCVPPDLRGVSVLSPFVGRENEMARLCDLLEKQRAGIGLNSSGGARHQVVCVKGEAGIGKSRLVHEFVENCCSGDEFVVLRGHSLSFAQPPYWAWTEILRNLLDIQRGSSQDFSQFFEKLTVYGESLTESAPFLASLLSIDTGDSRLEQLNSRAVSLETRVAFRKLLEALSHKGKLVVVLEDVHWLDEDDRQILKTVAENCITEHPIVLILIHRPEREDGIRIEFEFNSAVTSCDLIEVSEVDEAASRELVRKLLGSLSETGVDRVYETTARFLFTRSSGNPFYLEELVFDLTERGVLVEQGKEWKLDVSVDELSVPDSLTGLIQSRLDRLPESWKSVLQNSSVLGIEFQLKLYWKLVKKLYLGRCHTDVFDGLEHKQMLQSELIAFEKKYLFRHILVHDTAYSSIIKSNLKKLHRAAAESMEEMFPGELDSISVFLMHHYDKADEKGKAIEWGFKTMKRYTGEELLKITLRMESLLLEEQSGDQLDESVLKMLSFREKALDTLADRKEQRKTIQRMIDLAEKTGSDLNMAIALKKRGAMAMCTGDMKAALENMNKALELAHSAGDRHFQSIVLGNLGGLLGNQGQIDQAQEYFEKALEIHRETGDLNSEGIILMNLGVMQKARGHMTRARDYYKQSIEIARKVGDRITVANALGNTGSLLWSMGLLGEAGDNYRESLDMQRELGNRRSEGLTLGNLGILLMNQKKYDEAQCSYLSGLKIVREIGDSLIEGSILGNLGILYSNQSMLDEARSHYEKALEINRRVGNTRMEGTVLGNLGNIHYKQGHLSEARNMYEQALKIHGKTDSQLGCASVYASLGCVCFLENDIEEAQRNYMKSYSTASEMKLGIENFDGLIDLRQKMLSAGHSMDDLPWPSHWEPYQAGSEQS